MKLVLIFFLVYAILNIYKDRIISRIEKKAIDEKEMYEYVKSGHFCKFSCCLFRHCVIHGSAGPDCVPGICC